MALGELQNEADLKRWLARYLRETKGVVSYDQLAGGPSVDRIILRERDSDPATPEANSVVVYAKDNGAGKTAIYALYPTGVPLQISVEA